MPKIAFLATPVTCGNSQSCKKITPTNRVDCEVWGDGEQPGHLKGQSQLSISLELR